MEWVQGINLEELIVRNRNGVPAAEALEMVRLTASALHAAYTRPQHPGGPSFLVIHRDIKPSNLLITIAGEIKVVDFGTAHGRFDGRESETISMVLGARAYLAPERLDGAEDRPEGDVYALGHVLYELLCGTPLQLSLHPFHHQKMLDAHLGDLEPDGLDANGRDQIRKLIAEMCCYVAEDRPSHAQVTMRLTRLLARQRLEPDMANLGKTLVEPYFQDRAERDPREHPAYPEVAFLESGTELPAVAREIDDRIRKFLKRSNWVDEIDQLRSTLSVDPSWTPAPFIEVLRGARSPWWRFWSRDKLTPREIAAILETLQARRTGEVREQAELYQRHPDPGVQYLASELVK
jgi:serine/threonine protein kinase